MTHHPHLYQDGHADGGIMWPVFAAEDGNFNLFPFAKSGATCSNNLTTRPFPSVFESQLPLYFTEKANGSLKLRPEETIYTLWIGTNDVGVSALLTGSQTPGVTVVDTVACAVNWVKVLYASGARNFIFQNVRLAYPSEREKLIDIRPSAVDDPTRARPAVCGRLIPKQVLDGAAQHDGMERVYEGAHHVRERDREADAASSRAKAARCTPW